MSIGKFSEFYVDVTKDATKIPQEQYLAAGRYPIIDQGQKSIAGMWDNPDGLYEKVPAIVFGDHTRTIKYVDTPFFIGADGVKVLRPVQAGDNVKYLFYVLQAARIPNLGYSRHFKVVKELKIRMYPRKKQDEIVRVLEHIDSLLEQRQNEILQMDQLVKSRFMEIFEKCEFERIPFEAFCEFLRNGASIKQTKGAGGYPITRIETLANDAFNLDRLGYANITELKGFEKYILQKGDILISHINSVAYLGRAVQYRGESNTPIIHGMNLLCARLRHDCNSTYVEYFFKTPMAKDYISTITKKAVNQASITTTDLKKMLIPAPPLELQNRFAAFVAEVDKSKLAVKQSLEKLETLKKSLMQQYFG